MSEVIQNKVKALCDSKKIDRTSFIGICLSSKRTSRGRRLKADTAGRVYDGAIDITLETAGLVAVAMGVDLSELFTIK